MSFFFFFWVKRLTYKEIKGMLNITVKAAGTGSLASNLSSFPDQQLVTLIKSLSSQSFLWGGGKCSHEQSPLHTLRQKHYFCCSHSRRYLMLTKIQSSFLLERRKRRGGGSGQRPGSMEVATSQAYRLLSEGPTSTPAHLSPFPPCILNSKHLPVKLSLASGALHMLFPLLEKSFQTGYFC